MSPFHGIQTMAKRRKIWVNVAHSFEEAEEFDIKFWRSVGVAARFVAAWSIICDYYKMRGKNERVPRLRRTVQNIEQL